MAKRKENVQCLHKLREKKNTKHVIILSIAHKILARHITLITLIEKKKCHMRSYDRHKEITLIKALSKQTNKQRHSLEHSMPIIKW